jgi:GDPmannose 4,6-dehydratase
VEIDPRFYRPQEVPYLLGDSSKAQKVLNWKPKTDLAKLAEIMLQHDIEEVSRSFPVPGV